MKSSSLLLFLLLLLVSCAEYNSPSNESKLKENIGYSDMAYESEEAGMIMPRTAESPPPPPPVPASEESQAVSQKIIKNGFMGIKVDQLTDGKLEIDQLVSKYKAHYANEEYRHSDYQSTYTLNIRIPVDQFETFIRELESGNGEVQSKNITSRNVTEEFVDLNIRLKNKEAYLKQYHNLLKESGSVKDLLEVQERIRNLSEEIEATKGRLRYLSDQVGHSTLHLTLTQYHEQVLAKVPMNIGKRLGNALEGGLEGMISLLIGIVSIWPIVIFGLALIVFRGKIFRMVGR